MSQVQNTVKQTNVTKALNTRKLLNISPDMAMAKAEQLRSTAAENHEQYVLQGRKAMLSLMTDIYSLYHSTKKCNDAGAEFMTKVKGKLKELKVEVRKSSPESSQLIRYICKDFDDKQVSIYGRSIAFAFKSNTAPSDFRKLIEDTAGGFTGLSKNQTSTTKIGEPKTAAEIALVHARAEKTVDNFSIMDWKDDEEFRVLIALRNDDDTADVKDAGLSEENQKAVLLRYEADKKARNKPTKDQDNETAKLALQTVLGEVTNTATYVENVEAELNLAMASKNPAHCLNLRATLMVAQLKAKAAEKMYKSLKESLENPTAT